MTCILGHFTKVWQWIAVLAICLLMIQPAYAGSVQELRVVGVGIDDSSATAQELALDYAKKRAVFLAARKMGVRDANKALEKLTEEQWQEVLRGATISQSRRDGYTTYIEANVTVVTEALRRALKLPDTNDTAPTLYDSRGVLLLSAYIGKERAYLWEKENALRGPVSDEILRQSHGTVLLPGGDLEDLKLIDYQNALTVKPDELKPMYDRYGADEIIIALLKLGELGTKDSSNVLLRRLRPDGVRNETLDIPVVDEQETTEVKIKKAAAAIAGTVTQIATSTSERDTKARAHAKTVNVRFFYRTPRDLAQMQQLVRKAPEVLYLDVPSIELSRMTGTIYLKGSDEALREHLGKDGVVVTTLKDGWRLSMQ